MIRLLGGIPKTRFCIAVSGGADSMALLHFLSRSHKNNITVLHVNHNENDSAISEELVKTFCSINHIDFASKKINVTLSGNLEAQWRDFRYSYFDSIELPVLLAHNLDDVVETWVFSSLNGQSKIIPYQRNRCTRPFLLNKKETLLQYCSANNVPFVTEEANSNTRFARVKIRNMMPQLLEINPGLHKMLANRVLEKFHAEHNR